MDSGEGKPPRGADRRLLLVGAGTALALMVLVVVTTASRTPILRSPDRDPNIHIHYATLQRSSSPPDRGATHSSQAAANGGPNALGNIVLIVVLILLVAVVLWLIVAVALAAVRRWRQRRRVRQRGSLPELDDAVLDAVAEAAGRQEQCILEGTPSNAVVACWVDLEQAVAQEGVERRPSETSAELTIRVLDALDVDRRALRTLGSLYREARYSSHPLTEQQRRSAQEALSSLHRSLPLGTQERV